MTQDEIIEMARQVGLDPDLWNYTDAFERFAKLVAEHAKEEEREACAKVCEDSVEYAGDTLAEAIRARGYKQDGQCKLCTDGCPACDATKLPKEAHDLF